MLSVNYFISLHNGSEVGPIISAILDIGIETLSLCYLVKVTQRVYDKSGLWTRAAYSLRWTAKQKQFFLIHIFIYLFFLLYVFEREQE